RRQADPEIEAELGVTYVRLAELLSTSDLISVHLPLNDMTRGFLDAGAFAQMKPGCRLVNTARAEIVDRAALIQALQSGQLGSAAFDVLYDEPAKEGDRKSTRLNSSHVKISYAVFCLKKNND